MPQYRHTYPHNAHGLLIRLCRYNYAQICKAYGNLLENHKLLKTLPHAADNDVSLAMS
jgi:hypothetical protein